MANLDDFFAKKDKKKGKKSGFSKANTDVLAKNLEEADQKEKKAESAKATSGSLATSEATKLAFESSSIEPRQNSQNDEEWLEYKKEKDYSGLKIEKLTVGGSQDNEDDDGDESDTNEDGEKVKKSKKNKKNADVWAKKNNQDGSSSPETSRRNDSDSDSDSDEKKSDNGADNSEAKTAASAVADSNGPPKSSYVPPHMRNQAATMASGPSMMPTRLGGGGGPGGHRAGGRNRAAPDINSEVYFPSLSGAGAPEDNASKGNHSDYKEVRSGGGQRETSSKSIGNQRIALGNKYDALRE